MPLTQPPCEAQVDFGYALACVGGALRKVAFFVMTLVHSDAMFVMAFPGEYTEAFLEAHVAAFAFFGFVPSRISYDNTKVAVAQILGPHERKLTTAFARLVGHYLFDPHFCRVRRANEKGVVEGLVRYARQNFFVPVPQVEGFAELNAHLRACCESDMTRRLRGKTLSKRQLLEAREDRRLERMLKQLSRQDLLILDELGYVPFTKAGAGRLFEVVSRAYERQSLIVTTNLPFEQWLEVCGSERLIGAMLDRLTHRVHIVEANGESYRLRDSQRRMRRRRVLKPSA